MSNVLLSLGFVLSSVYLSGVCSVQCLLCQGFVCLGIVMFSFCLSRVYYSTQFTFMQRECLTLLWTSNSVFLDLVKFVMCTIVSRDCLCFCQYIKRHLYPGNQGTHDKLNQIRWIDKNNNEIQKNCHLCRKEYHPYEKSGNLVFFLLKNFDVMKHYYFVREY